MNVSLCRGGEMRGKLKGFVFIACCCFNVSDKTLDKNQLSGLNGL